MSDQTIFKSCSANFTVENNLTGLLECLSSTHESDVESLSAGVDTFYLIFAGALVYFMQTGFAVRTKLASSARSVMMICLQYHSI